MPVDLGHKIQLLRRSLGKNQAEFARMFEVTQGSVSRWENGSMPEAPALLMLADLAKQSVVEFLGGNAQGATSTPLGAQLYVKGSVAAGQWKEAFEWEMDDWEPYTGGAHIEANPNWRFGLKVDGDSMDMVYPHGTVLDCVSIFSSDMPESGRRVVVLRRRSDDALEATVKEFIIDADGKRWLVPRSHNPAFQRPISLDEEEPGIEETRIIARVVGSYRPE